MSHRPLDLDALQQRLAAPAGAHELAARLKARASEMGFMLCGITAARPTDFSQYFNDWLASGQAGQMHYLHSRLPERLDIGQYLVGAKSVICLAMNYHVPLEASQGNHRPGDARADTDERVQEVPDLSGDENADEIFLADQSVMPPRGELPLVRHRSPQGTGDPAPARIARYALGEDYHHLVKKRIFDLADWFRAQSTGIQTRACIDTAPVMEKEQAARAGLGWMGKNTCIIHPRLGSWFFIGVIVTTAVLPVDAPAIDRCGTCTRCLEACPTGALTGPYQMDARKCISYLTIEHRDEIDPALKMHMGDWLFGCDICQEVCPFNTGRELPVSAEPGFQPRFTGGKVDASQVLTWNDEEYRQTFRRSAVKRVKLPVLKRNALIVIDNSAGSTSANGG